MCSGKSDCIRAMLVWFYSGRSGCICFSKSGSIRASGSLLQKWLYSGKSGCIWAKVVVFGQNGCIRAGLLYLSKVVLFGQKWLYSCKRVVFWQNWMYSDKTGCLPANCFFRAKVVVFGKCCNLGVGKSGCVRAKWLYSESNVVVFGQKDKMVVIWKSGCRSSGKSVCIRAKVVVLGKVVVFGQSKVASCCTRAKVVVFGC